MPPQYIKYTRKLPQNIKKNLILIIEKILIWNIEGLDVKLLQGVDNMYRCRVGKLRIIFHQRNDGKGEIISIGSRGDIYK